MKNTLIVLSLFLMITCSPKDSDIIPTFKKQAIDLKFDSFFSKQVSFNFNPDKFWCHYLIDQKSIILTIDASIGTNNIDKIYVLDKGSPDFKSDYLHTFRAINLDGSVDFEQITSQPLFCPSDVTGGQNNECIISETSELPGLHFFNSAGKYFSNKVLSKSTYLENYPTFVNPELREGTVNKITNNLKYDLLFQYDTHGNDNLGIYKLQNKFIGIVQGGNKFSSFQLDKTKTFSSLTFDSKNLVWLLDYTSSIISVYDTKGKLIKQIGNNFNLKKPLCITTDYQGFMYICDTGNNRIVVLDEEGNLISTFGELGNGNGEFDTPTDICILKNSLYVIDKKNNRIQTLKINRT